MSKQTKWKFELGIEAKDMVTQLCGIIDARAEWLNGCLRYSIQPPIKSGERKAPDSFWIDEGQLRVVGEGFAQQPKRTGGPRLKSSARTRSK